MKYKFNLYILILLILAAAFFPAKIHAINLNSNEQSYSLLQEETEESEDEEDVSDDEIEENTQKWNLLVTTKAQSREVNKGIEVSGQRPAMSENFTISHENGLSGSLGFNHYFAPAQFVDYNIGLDYTFSLASWLDMGVSINRTKYANDTVNTLSGTAGFASIYADFITKIGIFDVSIDRYFGGDKITYFSLAYLHTFKSGDFRFTPMLSVSYSSYNIKSERSKLLDNIKDIIQNKKAATEKVFSLSSVDLNLKIAYDLGSGFSAAFVPGLIYFGEQKTSTGSNSAKFDFISYLSLSYNLDF